MTTAIRLFSRTFVALAVTSSAALSQAETLPAAQAVLHSVSAPTADAQRAPVSGVPLATAKHLRERASTTPLHAPMGTRSLAAVKSAFRTQ